LCDCVVCPCPLKQVDVESTGKAMIRAHDVV
jgi:hypothetical protein